MKPLIDEYKEEVLPEPCLGTDSTVYCEIEPQDPKVSFVVKAVSALTAAFKLLQLDRCTTLMAPGRRRPGPDRESCFQQVSTT